MLGRQRNWFVYLHILEKAMAPHSSTLAWKIPRMEEPGGLQSMGSRKVGHDWATSLSLFTFHFHALEKEMATHSSVLAWRIPGMGEPGGLPSMRLHRVGHDWSDLAAAAYMFKSKLPHSLHFQNMTFATHWKTCHYVHFYCVFEDPYPNNIHYFWGLRYWLRSYFTLSVFIHKSRKSWWE